MIEDRLTRGQRIRLEALNQAIGRTNAMMGSHTDADVLARAERYEEFLLDAPESLGFSS